MPSALHVHLCGLTRRQPTSAMCGRVDPGRVSVRSGKGRHGQQRQGRAEHQDSRCQVSQREASVQKGQEGGEVEGRARALERSGLRDPSPIRLVNSPIRERVFRLGASIEVVGLFDLAVGHLSFRRSACDVVSLEVFERHLQSNRTELLRSSRLSRRQLAHIAITNRGQQVDRRRDYRADPVRTLAMSTPFLSGFRRVSRSAQHDRQLSVRVETVVIDRPGVVRRRDATRQWVSPDRARLSRIGRRLWRRWCP
jgi:hypothetical protein